MVAMLIHKLRKYRLETWLDLGQSNQFHILTPFFVFILFFIASTRNTGRIITVTANYEVFQNSSSYIIVFFTLILELKLIFISK